MTTPGSTDATWSVFVAETLTGRVVESEIPVTGSPRAERRVNTGGDVQITVPMTRSFGHAEVSEYLYPWKYSFGLAYGTFVVQAGPLVRCEYDAYASCWELTCSGLWGYYTQKRLALYDATYQASSLSDIAALYLLDSKTIPGGALPVDVVSPTPGTGHVRTVLGSDLSSVGEMLSNLTDDVSGPELEFHPYFPNPEVRDTVRWELRRGDPHLGQLGYPHQWTTGRGLVVARPAVIGDRLADLYRVRSVGAGTGDQTVIGVSDSTVLRDSGYPVLMDRDDTHNDIVDQSTADRYAEGNRSAYVNGSNLITATVLVHGGEGPALGAYLPGDTCVLQVSNYAGVRPGRYSCRILGLQPSSESTVDLELQVVSVLPG